MLPQPKEKVFGCRLTWLCQSTPEPPSSTDAAVHAAYGITAYDDPLAFLLALNHQVAERGAKDEPVTAPGFPSCVTDAAAFVTDDCVRPSEL
jgi:hypothetical protein